MSGRPSRPPTPTLDELVARTEGRQPWRQVSHVAAGVLVAGVLHLLEPARVLAASALGGLAALLFLWDAARLRTAALNRLFFRVLRPMASPREAAAVASSTWFVAGCALTVALFPREIAVPALLVLALADPAASYVGRRWGRRPIGTGTVEGSLVFAAVAVAVLLPFSRPFPALVAAAVATAIERAGWPLDDNLAVPLVTGAVLWGFLTSGG